MRDQGPDPWMRVDHELLPAVRPTLTRFVSAVGMREGSCMTITRMMKMPFQQQAGYVMEIAI